MVLRGDMTIKQAADDLGVSPYSIYEWKKKFFPPAALPGWKGTASTGLALIGANAFGGSLRWFC
jgi:hypothetical protein